MKHHTRKGRRPKRLLGVGLLCLAACGPSQEQTAAVGRYLLESLVYARQSADTVMLEEIFEPDATYDVYPEQITYRGSEELVGYLTAVHDWGDEVYLNLGSVQTSEGGAVGEWFFAAVQSRPIPDVITSITNAEVVLSGVTVIEIAGGRILRAADYFDRAAMMLQLGGRIEMPDGTVIDSGIGSR